MTSGLPCHALREILAGLKFTTIILTYVSARAPITVHVT